MTILGTRPEIIRLSLILKKLDRIASKHIVVHTGQNFTASLNDIFFKEMDIRKPDYVLSTREHSLGQQLSLMFRELEILFNNEKPDKVLILGDTNSALSAILAERMNIPVYHMEAGNRCNDLRVPEEKNRKTVDAISMYNLPYTPKSRENLLREGVPSKRIMMSGNPIYEVLDFYKDDINKSTILKKMNLNSSDYFLTTIHRAENVDNPENLKLILEAINLIAATFKKRVVCSVHPRTRSKINALDSLNLDPLIELEEPFGFFDFVQLEKNAVCVLTDSGTVQEECCLYRVPTVTVRNTTERPETVECGSNVVTGLQPENILNAVNVMITQQRNWEFPTGYADSNVSDKVVKFLIGGNESVE